MTIVDACVRQGSGGSPTSVLWDVVMSESERRQVPKLACTSHAVFVSPIARTAFGHQVALRFFTAAGELPACGHGTVAALAFLAADSRKSDYVAELRAGGRSFAGRAIRSTQGYSAMFDPGEITLRPATPEECRLVHASFGDHPEIRSARACVANAPRPRLLVEVQSDAELMRLAPNLELLGEGSKELQLLGCYVYSLGSNDGRLRARMFAPAIGVPEDIANANSTACLAVRLARDGALQIDVEMGDSLGTPSTVTATTERNGSALRVRVGGSAVVASQLELRSI